MQRNNFILYKTIFLDFTLYVGQHKKKKGGILTHPPTLYRKIKQYSDLSILELTRNIRLKKAAELLASQQYSVQEVAEMVGFNDTATFRKRFTEQYGVTPSQYGIPA